MVSKVGTYWAAGAAALGLRAAGNVRRLGEVKPGELPAMLERRAPDVERAGFGQGTVSVPGAAFHTIKRGMDGARETVPTVEELRGELRERLSRECEAREAESERLRTATRALQTTKSAKLSFGRDDARGGASLQIKGEINKYTTVGETQPERPSTPTFDMTV